MNEQRRGRLLLLPAQCLWCALDSQWCARFQPHQTDQETESEKERVLSAPSKYRVHLGRRRVSRSPKEEIESNLIKPPTRLTKLPQCLLNAERFEERKEWVSQQHQRIAGSPPAMLLLLSLSGKARDLAVIIVSVRSIISLARRSQGEKAKERAINWQRRRRRRSIAPLQCAHAALLLLCWPTSTSTSTRT